MLFHAHHLFYNFEKFETKNFDVPWSYCYVLWAIACTYIWLKGLKNGGCKELLLLYVYHFSYIIIVYDYLYGCMLALSYDYV